MKKFVAICLAFSMLLIGFSPISSSNDIEDPIRFLHIYDGNDDFNIETKQNNDIITINLHINDFQMNPWIIQNEKYYSISIGEESQIINKGHPDVPNICRSIIIPNEKHMNINILDVSYQDITNINITPSKGDIIRPNSPETTPFTFSDIYHQDTWYPKNIVYLRDPYMIRNIRGQTVVFNPFQYNPFQKTLRVYTSINIEIIPEEQSGNNNIINTGIQKQVPRSFSRIYEEHFLNFGNQRYSMVLDVGNMLVICYDSFYDEMVPFVEWKNMKGIPTEMVNLSDIGSTAYDIDTYIENYYLNNNLTFVLLVGDIGQIPSLYYSGHASDPSYSYIVGSDNYQDIFIGRFSGQTGSEISTQVNRTIDYEKYPQADAEWYHNGTGIGSPEGTGDDNEYDWEHIRNLRILLYNFTYTNIDEFYGGSQGGDDAPGEPDTTDVVNAINAGRSFLNHCGHGAWDGIGWGAMPGWYVLHNNDINILTNENKLPFVILVACNSGEFESYTSCFAETWMRATNNGIPTGAIGVFASTQSQSWSPPMEAQDEITDLLVDSSYDTMGGLAYSGTMSMMDEYGSSCYDETNTWTLFGDPSLQMITDTPQTMTVIHDSAMMSGGIDFSLTVDGVEGALCAISYNGELLGHGYTDANGDALINFSEPIQEMETVELVVTAFNKIPYITTLDVTPPLRNIAEFEPMQGVLIRYPFGISYQIIAEMSEDVTVTTIVANTNEQNYVASQYAANGVNTSNCEYLIAPSDSYWTRDFGPWFRYNSSNNLIEVVDFTYNRNRPNDNNIPNAFANFYGLNYTLMDIIHTGGNYMTDGQGISVSTELVLTENPSKTREEIQNVVRDYLGISSYHIYPDPLGEYIEHVDCWAKFLSSDTIMVIEVHPTHSQYTDIENAASYFASQISSSGDPYNVVRVYCHLNEPYVNSLILNDKVLVPITGSTYDAAALSAYESAMPGYEVLGFTGSWQNTDALHCRSKGIPDFDMINIEHETLINQIPNPDGFMVDAYLNGYGNSRGIYYPEIYWKNSSGIWNNEPMILIGDIYQGTIPNHACGETIHYYISASNSEGDNFQDPFIGPEDPYNFTVTLVPDIWTDPVSFSLSNSEGAMIYDKLMVGNDKFAGADLNITLTATDQEGYGWLSINVQNASIQPNASISINVSVDTTGLPVGEYTEAIQIESNDPDESHITIPVHLTIVFAHDVGVTTINYPTGTISHGDYLINATISNFGSADKTDVSVNCTVYSGGVGGTILYEDFTTNPPDWTITNTQGTGWQWDSTDRWMENTYSSSTINAGYLDSPIIDCTGKMGINLTFWHHWKASYSSGDQDGYVRGSIDGGVTYPYLIDEFHHNNPSEETGVKTYELNWAENQAQVRIRYDVTNDDDYYWRIDNVNVSSSLSGNIIHTSETQVNVSAYSSEDVEFPDAWNASMNGLYTIQVSTKLTSDQDPGNDHIFSVIDVFKDTTPPQISDITVQPNPQIINGSVNISCIVIDETIINEVFVQIYGPEGFIPVNVSMVSYVGDVFFYEMSYSVIGNYSFSIFSSDLSGNSQITSGLSFKIVNESYIPIDIELNEGWNLLTVPVIRLWDASDLAENISGCMSVSQWDSINQTYQTYIVGGPPGFDFPLTNGYGYFVDVTPESVFSLIGLPISMVNVPLYTGWNLIGWYNENSTTASSISENITGCLSVSQWDSVNQTYQTYIVGGPPGFDFDVTFGMGLFIDVNQQSIWHGEG